jgi:hypothetical protein
VGANINNSCKPPTTYILFFVFLNKINIKKWNKLNYTLINIKIVLSKN